MIQNFEDACEFVFKHKVCTIFGSKHSPHPSLWDNVNLSEEKPAAGGWPPKVSAIWRWKNEIPQTFPEEIFYGKISGSDAVLMEMEYLKKIHYPQAFRPISEFDNLTQRIYEYIQIEPWFTGDLRGITRERHNCTKSQFDTRLTKLQISLNITRSNDPNLKNDQWLPFKEVYSEIVEQYS